MIQIVKATIKEGVTPEIGNSGTTTDIPSIFPSFNQNHCTATVAVATANTIATPREDSITLNDALAKNIFDKDCSK